MLVTETFIKRVHIYQGMAKVRLKNLRKEFEISNGVEVAIEGIDTTINDENLTCLLGPSGCGKTTLLRMIAGLESPSEGRIHFDETDVTDTRVQDRGVSMVFQNIALFPFKSVHDNIAYGLKYEDVSKSAVNQKVNEIASQLDIAEFLNQMPNQLSGGQQQRVALGRSLIRDPEVFLLDEPMSALDERIRIRLRTELKELQRELATTTVYVTHNQEQAMALSDEIIILNDGKIEQQGAPDVIFDKPANIFVAEFIGSPRINLLAATINNNTLTIDGTDLSVELSEIYKYSIGSGGREILLGIRPSQIKLSPVSTDESLQGNVTLLERLGQSNVAFINCPDIEKEIRVETDRMDIEEGRKYDLSFDPADVHLFDHESGETMQFETPAKAIQ